MINSRVDGVSVIRCPTLALAKHLQRHRSLPLINPDMELRASAVALGFSSSKSREMPSAWARTLDGLRI